MKLTTIHPKLPMRDRLSQAIFTWVNWASAYAALQTMKDI